MKGTTLHASFPSVRNPYNGKMIPKTVCGLTVTYAPFTRTAYVKTVDPSRVTCEYCRGRKVNPALVPRARKQHQERLDRQA